MCDRLSATAPANAPATISQRSGGAMRCCRCAMLSSARHGAQGARLQAAIFATGNAESRNRNFNKCNANTSHPHALCRSAANYALNVQDRATSAHHLLRYHNILPWLQDDLLPTYSDAKASERRPAPPSWWSRVLGRTSLQADVITMQVCSSSLSYSGRPRDMFIDTARYLSVSNGNCLIMIASHLPV
eukprot:3888563-Pleurochrysis_carterae.AAC.4